MESVLIIDDEEDIREILAYSLQKEGFTVFIAANGAVGLQLAEKHLPDIVILDVMMPEMDGIEVCEQLRANPRTANLRVCFLTARSEDYSQIAGFEAGADDFVSKPIKPRVLISRINAILRRGTSDNVNKGTSTKRNIITIDRERYLVLKNGVEIQLPRKEFELISLLVSKPEKVFERDVIMDTVWGDDVIVGNRTIDVHIRKLREKLGEECIQTVKGVGYKYSES